VSAPEATGPAADPDRRERGSESPLERRRNALFARWSQGGKLGKTELKEISDLLPKIPADPDRREMAEEAPAKPVYEKNLEDYAPIYSCSVRQIHRWIAFGKARKPPELPPLDAPAEMAAWWLRNMKNRAPAKLLALAAQKETGEASLTASAIDLTKLEGAAGDGLRQARAVRMAADQHLTEAYASKSDERIEICQRRWLRAVEQERKLEAAAREDAKASGALIPRGELLPELSQTVEVFGQMTKSSGRRIKEKFSAYLSPELAERLKVEVENEWKRCFGVFRRLEYLTDLDEIDNFELTAADEA
jgi:hypothetical protein